MLWFFQRRILWNVLLWKNWKLSGLISDGLFVFKRHWAQRGAQVELCSFSTSALDGYGWSTPRPGRFDPQEATPVSIEEEVGWDTGSVRTQRWRREKSLAAIEFQTPDRPVISEWLYRLPFLCLLIVFCFVSMLYRNIFSKIFPYIIASYRDDWATGRVCFRYRMCWTTA
jgi:hypothetical protein